VRRLRLRHQPSTAGNERNGSSAGLTSSRAPLAHPAAQEEQHSPGGPTTYDAWLAAFFWAQTPIYQVDLASAWWQQFSVRESIKDDLAVLTEPLSPTFTRTTLGPTSTTRASTS
jgi:hypothetical protein